MNRSADPGAQRSRPDWRGQLAVGLTGTAGGTGTNILSNHVGHQGIAAAAVAGAVLAAASWLRKPPRRTAPVRYTVRVLLVLSLVGAVVAAFGPSSWTVPVTFAAAALATAAVVVLDNAENARALLAGGTVVSSGVVGIGIGITLLVDGHALFGVAIIAGAMAVIGIGIALLADSDALPGGTLVNGGAAIIGFGIAPSADGDALFGVMFIGVGAAFIGFGIAQLADSDALLGGTLISVGAVLIGFGIALLADSNVLFGGTLIGAAVALIVLRIDPPIDGDVLLGVALIWAR